MGHVLLAILIVEVDNLFERLFTSCSVLSVLSVLSVSVSVLSVSTVSVFEVY